MEGWRSASVAAGIIAFTCSLSACGSSASQPSAAVQSSSSSASAAATPVPGQASVGTPGAGSGASASAGNSLKVTANVDLGALPLRGEPIVAETPDGAVFYADGQVVMVDDGNGSPQVAEHVGAEVLAVGASTSMLYVVTPQALIAYGRPGGGQAGRWAITGSPATPTTAGITVGDGTIWVWTDWATDFSGYEDAMVYAVPSGAAKAEVLSKAAEPGTLTTDGTHAFFLVQNNSSMGASLMESSPTAGTVTVGAAPTMTLVGYSRSQVILYKEPGSLYTYTPGASGTGTVQAPVGDSIADAATSSGLLFLTCTKTACSTVTAVDQSTGAVGPSVTVPLETGLLLGPDPVVVGVQARHVHLIRLS